MDDKRKVKTISEIEKFVVNSEDELIDIVEKINASKASKVILTFTEPSDILISPINFKVLQDTADEKGKAVIAQIVQNPVGVRNAKEAGITVTEATGTIMNEYWVEAEKGLRRRLRGKEDKLLQTNMRIGEDATLDEMGEDSPSEIILDNTQDETLEPPAILEEVVKEKSEFQKKIENALMRSKNAIEQKDGKLVEEGGITLALDKDIEQSNKQALKESKKIGGMPSLIGRDIAYLKTPPEDETIPSKDDSKDTPKPVEVKTRPTSKSPLLGFMGGLSSKIASAPLKKIAIRILAPLLALLIVGLWLLYELAPLAKVTLYIEVKPVEIEKVFNGSKSANEFNYEEGIVPIKTENSEKSVSGTTTATGTAFRGNKAEGVVTIKYWGLPVDLPRTIPKGSILTANTGETYELLNDVTVGDDGSFIKLNVAVRATQVGEEYNISGGKTFSIQGYNQTTEFSAENSNAFAGGSKESYTVLSQSDVDKIVKDIKEGAVNDVTSDLEEKSENGWEIIQSTIKVEPEGSPKTDVPVGAEADIVNVTINVKGVATYFKKGELESKMDDVLTKSAQDQNLFDTEGDIELELDSNIEKEITVEDSKTDSIKIKVVAKGKVKPKLNRNDIIKELQGKKWKEGEKILKEKSLSKEKGPDYSFVPEYFPESLKYFPTRQGRIVLNIKDITQN